MTRQPFYDPDKSYEENYDQGPFGLFAKKLIGDIPASTSDYFLGFRIDVPFGIPAGPLLNSKFIRSAWEWGYSLTTYKTVRGNSFPCHPHPNLVKVYSHDKVIWPGETVFGKTDLSDVEIWRQGITNSFGVPSKPVSQWQKDVKLTLSQMKSGNVLILSFMGTKKEGMTLREYVEDFRKACLAAKATGAPVLEVNFSCPNIGKEGLICNDLETSRAILETLKLARGNTPLLVKIGYFPHSEQTELEKLLHVIYENASGVVAINTIQVKVVDTQGKQILPGSPLRLHSGICGTPIRWAGMDMAERIMSIKHKNNWSDFTVVGVGGVTEVDDYIVYKRMGVDAVQSATGAMWRPTLAYELRNKLYARPHFSQAATGFVVGTQFCYLGS